MDAPWHHHVLAHTPLNQLIIIGLALFPVSVCGRGSWCSSSPMVPPWCAEVRLREETNTPAWLH